MHRLLCALACLLQTTIPWDSVDPSYLTVPRRWSAKNLAKFMLVIGPLSSIFDVTTFLLIWYTFHYTDANNPEMVAKAQTCWFLESLLSQTFVVHLLRTERIPFLQSWAALPVLISTFGAMGIGYALPYIPGMGSNGFLQMAAVPLEFYGMLAAILVCYCVIVQSAKVLYKRWSDSWL